MITVENFQEIFAGILNSKDLEGLRLLVTQFRSSSSTPPADRKTEKALGMQGVSYFDCHVNGHTSARRISSAISGRSRTDDGSTRPALRRRTTSSGCSAPRGP